MLMAAFDVGIFPYSNPYGSPQKILEYMSCALPTICPDVPSVTEQFDKEYLPFLVKQDGSNFYDCVQYIYDNLQLCKDIARRNRELVSRKYTWAHNASRVVTEIRNASRQ
jgi:glycosyltransferase involved in cell wall biosynthesis